MTRVLLSVFFVFILSLAKSQKIDTITSFQWDTASHQFINSEEQILTYKSCNLTKYTIGFWDTAKAIYSGYYKSSNSLLANGAISQTTVQLWDDQLSKWANYQKAIYTYTSSATQPSSVLYQLWDVTTNSYKNSELYKYAYDTVGNNTSIIVSAWGTNWVNNYQNIYTYTSTNQLSSFVQQKWELTTKSWINATQVDFNYNSNNKLILDSGKNWNTNNKSWVPNYKNIYTLDINNTLQKSISFLWDTIKNSYANYQTLYYTNNSNGLPSEILTLGWNGGNWDTLSKDVYHYNSCTLPVDFTAFTAENNGSVTNLTWQIGNELNVKYYQIEFATSSNTKEFTKLSSVPAANKNAAYAYQHNTSGVVSKELFYRIKAIDFDGTVRYSPTKRIELNNTSIRYKVFPNPARGYVNIQGNNISEIVIRDIAGRVLVHNKYSSPVSSIQIPVASMLKGIVFLEIIDSFNKVINERIMVEK